MPDTLINKTEQNYGSDYKAHLFEQYKFYIEGVEKTNDRRINSNDYFIVINIFFICFLGFVSKKFELIGSHSCMMILCAVGILICIIWISLISSYKQLLVGKYKVVHEMEENLPLFLFKYEWQVLGEGKNIKKYLPFTIVESFIPWAFELIYVVLMVSSF